MAAIADWREAEWRLISDGSAAPLSNCTVRVDGYDITAHIRLLLWTTELVSLTTRDVLPRAGRSGYRGQHNDCCHCRGQRRACFADGPRCFQFPKHIPRAPVSWHFA
jgi:hypothetical protein